MPTGVYLRIKRPLLERFVEKVDMDRPGCWPWLGFTDPNGYGQISVDGRAIGAHRVSFELFCGPLSPGQVPDHLCLNPSCVRPSHLEAVSYAENTRRGGAFKTMAAKAAARTHCEAGHPWVQENIAMSGGSPLCLICWKQRQAEWRLRNRDRINERQRLRRAAKG